MSGKTSRQVRKGLIEIEKNVRASKREVADQLARELLNAPFKYRFKFAMKLIFRRKRSG